MKKAALLLISALCVSTQADAQFSFLKKAKEKLQEKVESKVSEKIGQALDTKQAPATATSATATPSFSSTTATAQGDNINYSDTYAPELGDFKWESGVFFSPEKANSTGDYDDEGQPVKRIKHPALHFASELEALNAMPAVPTVQQILNDGEESATAEGLIQYSLACQELHQSQIQQQTERAMQSTAALRGKTGVVGGSSTSAANSLASKMQEALMTSGLNFETASEEEVMATVLKSLSKELGVPEAEMGKLMAMGQTNPEAATAYLMKNYPAAAKKLGGSAAVSQPTTDATDALIEKFSPIIDEASAFYNTEELYQYTQRLVKINQELEAYASQLLGQWASSEACAKVAAMEKELCAKVEASSKSSTQNYGYDMPPFWAEERKKQNAVIDAYNATIVEQWRTKVQAYIDEVKPYALRMADLENRFEQMLQAEGIDNGTATPDAMHIISLFKNATTGFATFPFDLIHQLPATAMDAPRIRNVVDDPKLLGQ